jgi:hypothetical protein
MTDPSSVATPSRCRATAGSKWNAVSVKKACSTRRRSTQRRLHSCGQKDCWNHAPAVFVKPDIDDWLSVHGSSIRHAAGRERPRLLIGSGSRQAEKLDDGVGGTPMSNMSANNRFCIPASRLPG